MENFTVFEVREALRIGESALENLYAAQKNLDSARNWGIADMIGGGFLTSMVKHSKMDDAEEYLSEAKYQLKKLRERIENGALAGNMSVQVGGFLKFADLFCDGFVADYLVQSRINEARQSVAETIRCTEQLMEALRRKEREEMV